MKKIILFILVLCCLISACGQAEPPAPTSAAAPSPSAAGTGGLPLPLVKAGAVISELYKGKPLRPAEGCGLFLLCSDPVEMNQGSHYDAFALNAEGTLEQLKEQLFNNAYTLDGNRYHLNFDWTTHEGVKVATYVSSDMAASMVYLSDAGSESLFLLRWRTGQGSTVYNCYPVTLDLESGELTDFLAGCRLDSLDQICNAAFNPDRSGILLAQEGGAIYYCDLKSNAVYSLDGLSGEPVKACTLISDRIICWNQSGEGSGALGDYRFWSISLTDFRRQEMPALQTDVDTAALRFAHLAGFDSQLRGGRMFSGSRYALCTSGSGQTYVLDMEEWSLRAVEGYTLPASNLSCTGSPDGQRLLLKDTGSNKAAVLDYRDCTMVWLDIQNAERLIWFDSDTVLEQPGDGNFFLYDLK
ncbi:MAG: hypothetical protein ACI4O0_00425 [Candidatus Limivicinus sp.]